MITSGDNLLSYLVCSPSRKVFKCMQSIFPSQKALPQTEIQAQCSNYWMKFLGMCYARIRLDHQM